MICFTTWALGGDGMRTTVRSLVLTIVASVGLLGPAVQAVAAVPAATPAAAASADGDGGVLAFGDAALLGALAGQALNQPVVGMAADPVAAGYWLVARDGGVFPFGNAAGRGSTGGMHLNQPIVGMAASHSGNGYWLVAADGGIFPFGDAPGPGSTGNIRLNQPIVGMAPTHSGNGYWLVAADGGIFPFGDAVGRGSLGNIRLNQRIVGMAPSPSGNGYWLVAADGGIFPFGDAPGLGSLGNVRLNRSIVGMAASHSGNGYWLVAADGGIFPFGDAPGAGSGGGMGLRFPVVGMAATPSGNGYWLVQGDLDPFGGDLGAFVRSRGDRVSAAVWDARSGRTWVYGGGLFGTASIVKVQIMCTLLHRGATAQERQLMVPMIEESDNAAASTLWIDAGGAGPVQAFDRSIGMNDTFPDPNGTWGRTRTDAVDEVTMVRHVAYPNPALSEPDRAYALSLMEHVDPAQRWGVSGGVAPGSTIALKNGWAPFDGSWHINSIGWVQGAGREYALAVLTDGNPTMPYGIDTIQGVSARVFAALG
jgi:hypothetical protein